VKDGRLSHCRQRRSPNCDRRPAGQSISLLVIHNISLPPGRFGNRYIEDFFCNRLTVDAHPFFAQIACLHVSAHLVIDRLGKITQFVNFKDRAWHAGQSFFQDADNCNDFSIGIELEGTDTIPYTDIQYSLLVQVTQALIHAYPLLTAERIVGHCDIAPARKTDPGPLFDWRRYRRALQVLSV